eukprot:scaffold1422_cov175-Chaetoceros_neogracile.AAC.2
MADNEHEELVDYDDEEVDENVTAEKPQAADDGKEVKKTSPYHKAEPSRTELNEQEWNGIECNAVHQQLFTGLPSCTRCAR